MELVSFVWPYTTYRIGEYYKKCFGSAVLAQTSHGPIQGVRVASQFGYQFIGFQGVPYAKPPIGDLRFKVREKIEF